VKPKDIEEPTLEGEPALEDDVGLTAGELDEESQAAAGEEVQ
jgi:hypothetical protein